MPSMVRKRTARWCAVLVAACWPWIADAMAADADATAARPIEIAAVLPITGQAAAFGAAAIKGARVAVDEINAGGGVLGRLLALVPIDNRSTPLTTRQAAKEAVRRGVMGVVGAVWSTHSLAAAPVLQAAGVPMISPGSTAPAVTRVGDYIFRTCYTDDFQGKLMADFAVHALGGLTAVVFTNINETYSQTLARFFMEAFARNQGTVVSETGYKSSAADFGAILAPLTAAPPDVVFIPGYTLDSGLLIRQARSLGIGSTFLGGDAWEASIAEVAGAALEGSYFSTHWHPNVPYERSRRFISRYEAAYGNEDISPFSALAYDAVWLFAQAAGAAGSTDRRQVRDALAGVRRFDGATGAIAFDANGDPIRKGAGIMKYENGKWRFHKSFEPRQ